MSELINEGFVTSKVTRTKMDKLNALRGAFAVQIARQQKDPLYEKMIRFKKAYKLTRTQLTRKYGTKALLAARQAAAAHT